MGLSSEAEMKLIPRNRKVRFCGKLEQSPETSGITIGDRNKCDKENNELETNQRGDGIVIRAQLLPTAKPFPLSIKPAN